MLSDESEGDIDYREQGLTDLGVSVDVVLPPAEGSQENCWGNEPNAPVVGVSFVALHDWPHHQARQLTRQGQHIHQYLQGNVGVLLCPREESWMVDTVVM